MSDKIIINGKEVDRDMYLMLQHSRGRKRGWDRLKKMQQKVEPVKEIKIKTPEEIAEEDIILANTYERGTMGWVKQQKIKRERKG